MKKYLILIITIIVSITNVSADTYTTDTNLFESSYTNNLIDMAQSQIENFNYKKFVIIRIENDYYLFSSNDLTITGSTISMNNADIISAIRTSEGYSSTYIYDSKSEATTTINLNNIVVSNIDTAYSVSSSRYEDYKSNKSLVNIGIFILGLVFALFITKERSY